MNWWAISGLTMWVTGLVCFCTKNDPEILAFTFISGILLGILYLIIKFISL